MSGAGKKPFPANRVVTIAVILLVVAWAGYKLKPVVRTWRAAVSFSEDYNQSAQISSALIKDGLVPQVLTSFALDEERPQAVRIWSLITLRENKSVDQKKLAPLLRDADPAVALQAATAFGFANSDLGRKLLMDSVSTPAEADDRHHQFEAARALFHLGYGSKVVEAQYRLLAQGDPAARSFLLSLMTMEGGYARYLAGKINSGDIPDPELLLWWKDFGIRHSWTMGCEACVDPPVLHDPMPAVLATSESKTRDLSDLSSGPLIDVPPVHWPLSKVLENLHIEFEAACKSFGCREASEFHIKPAFRIPEGYSNSTVNIPGQKAVNHSDTPLKFQLLAHREFEQKVFLLFWGNETLVSVSGDFGGSEPVIHYEIMNGRMVSLDYENFGFSFLTCTCMYAKTPDGETEGIVAQLEVQNRKKSSLSVWYEEDPINWWGNHRIEIKSPLFFEMLGESKETKGQQLTITTGGRILFGVKNSPLGFYEPRSVTSLSLGRLWVKGWNEGLKSDLNRVGDQPWFPSLGCGKPQNSRHKPVEVPPEVFQKPIVVPAV